MCQRERQREINKKKGDSIDPIDTRSREEGEGEIRWYHWIVVLIGITLFVKFCGGKPIDTRSHTEPDQAMEQEYEQQGGYCW